MTCYAVIPAYNEAERVVRTIAEVKKYLPDIIVVDDGSHDNTFVAAKQTGVTVLQHKVNLGKGAAVKTGCDYALLAGATQLIVLDADTQHDPHEIPLFQNALKKNDLIFGYRQNNNTMPAVLQFGNWVISTSLRVLCHMNVNDSQCGYRAFTSQAYSKIRWNASDYYMETEMIMNAGKHHVTYSQVPIKTIYADKYKGTTIVDGVKIVAKMLGGSIFK